MRAMRVLLASRSPRRRELLLAAGLHVEVCPPEVDEAPRDGEPAAAMVLRLAIEKASTVQSSETVVAADTAVVLDGLALGKPLDLEDAAAMLTRLSGRQHEVLTGFCVRRGRERLATVVKTEVWFRALSPPEIFGYVSTGEPLDKAGAYGIQGLGGALIDRLNGSYTNVVGLPLAEVLAAIREVSP
ncbi:MAG: septum formation inhibitor Maf [Deltaproteobacteria bacterium]|nr:septum formation inhibitor Maf [Deltaproteobacteria bacterium]